MKNVFKVLLGVTALAATTAMAAPKYPFPQNMKNPYGYTVPFAVTDSIKSHFKTWMGAWYQEQSDGSAWILSPEGTTSTVSEAIAYGMLLMVYMSDNQNDYQTQFDKLYKTWTSNAASTNGGMNWRIGSSGGNGSATDSDIDAALALVMASVQWNNSSYLTAAKTLINWIETNDFDGTQLKPGNQWNEAFNPSYSGLANFRLFEKVTGNSSWSTHRSDVAKDLLACQNSSTGLVPDWCAWNSHTATKTNASVAQDEEAGFFDDAARTPWRTAWAYYWYGDSDALTFNTKVAAWLVPTTKTASGVNSGYYLDGTAEKSEKRNFVSSTFSGGLGLSTSSFADNTTYTSYMETVYKALLSLKSCSTASGCGESVTGEKYYPSTLNLLYMLLMTGNMPNLYDLTGFTAFTPDPSLMRSSDSGIDGIQQTRGDTTVGVSGFWNWGAYHDMYGETKMTPDSGASPIYLRDGIYYADAVMEIGAEPEWTEEAAAAGTLKYPSAGIAMSFKKDESGVDLKALGVKYLKLTVKSEGPIRVAVLSSSVAEAGGEPGIYIDETNGEYKDFVYDMTTCNFGFNGLASDCNSATADNSITILDWVNVNLAPTGDEILKNTQGLKFEVKDAKGGYGSISVKSLEFLDANKNVIDPAKLTGFTISGDISGETTSSSSTEVIGSSSSSTGAVVDPFTGIASVAAASMAKISVSGMQVQISGARVGSDFAVFSMQGKVIVSGKVFGASQTVSLPSKGAYLVRVGSKITAVTAK